MQCFQTHDNYVLKLVIGNFNLGGFHAIPHCDDISKLHQVRLPQESGWMGSPLHPIPPWIPLGNQPWPGGWFHTSHGLLTHLPETLCGNGRAITRKGRGMEGSFKQYLLLSNVTSTNRVLTALQQAVLVGDNHQALLSRKPPAPCLPRGREQQRGRHHLTLVTHPKPSGYSLKLHLHCEIES